MTLHLLINGHRQEIEINDASEVDLTVRGYAVIVRVDNETVFLRNEPEEAFNPPYFPLEDK